MSNGEHECICEFCEARVDAKALDFMCNFCWVWCNLPTDPDLPTHEHRRAEASFIGMIRWRRHQQRHAIEARGLDALEWMRRLRRGEKLPEVT